MATALDSQRGPDGGELNEMKRREVREMMTREQRGEVMNILVFFFFFLQRWEGLL